MKSLNKKTSILKKTNVLLKEENAKLREQVDQLTFLVNLKSSTQDERT